MAQRLCYIAVQTHTHTHLYTCLREAKQPLLAGSVWDYTESCGHYGFFRSVKNRCALSISESMSNKLKIISKISSQCGPHQMQKCGQVSENSNTNLSQGKFSITFVGDLIWNCWLWFWVKEIMRNLQKDYAIFFRFLTTICETGVHAQTCWILCSRSHSLILTLSQLLKPLKLSHSSQARQASYKRQDGTARHDTRRAEGSRNEARLSHLPSVAGLSWAIVVAAESAKHTTLSLSQHLCWLCYWWEGQQLSPSLSLLLWADYFCFCVFRFSLRDFVCMQTSFLLLLLLFELLLPPPALFLLCRCLRWLLKISSCRAPRAAALNLNLSLSRGLRLRLRLSCGLRLIQFRFQFRFQFELSVRRHWQQLPPPSSVTSQRSVAYSQRDRRSLTKFFG